MWEPDPSTFYQEISVFETNQEKKKLLAIKLSGKNSWDGRKKQEEKKNRVEGI